MLLGILIAVAVVFILLLALAPLTGLLVNIRGQQIGILERKYFGRRLPEGRVVALRGEVGYEAAALQPGLNVLAPFRYKVTKAAMIDVAEDEVGLVESIDGRSLDPGRIFARHVDGHDNFQDGEAFLRNGGQKG